MTIAIRESQNNFDDVKRQFKDIRDRITLEDLNPGNLRTDAPTTETLDKGKLTVVELSGVPWIYYQTISGVIYKIQMTAA